MGESSIHIFLIFHIHRDVVMTFRTPYKLPILHYIRPQIVIGSQHVPTIFPSFSPNLPRIFPWFSRWFSWFSNDFPMISRILSLDVQHVPRFSSAKCPADPQTKTTRSGPGRCRRSRPWPKCPSPAPPQPPRSAAWAARGSAASPQGRASFFRRF